MISKLLSTNTKQTTTEAHKAARRRTCTLHVLLGSCVPRTSEAEHHTPSGLRWQCVRHQVAWEAVSLKFSSQQRPFLLSAMRRNLFMTLAQLLLGVTAPPTLHLHMGSVCAPLHTLGCLNASGTKCPLPPIFFWVQS